MGRPVTRGVLIKEEHVETLKRLPTKTMDAVLGAAFRAAIGEQSALAVKDSTGILEALVQSISVAAQKFDENEVERKAKDAARKKKERENERKKAILKMLEASSSDSEEGEEDELHEKNQKSRGQMRTEADESGTEADESGQKGMKADKSGVRTERKKERRKDIYTPISPKGNSRFPPEVDVEEILGRKPGKGVEEGDGDPDEKEEESPAEDVTVAEVATRMAERHPNPSGTDSFPKSLVRYLKKNSGGDKGADQMLREIEESHGRWIESGAWDAEGGRYAPQLKNWLWGGDWKRVPPEKKRARPTEDADEFHAGASL